MVIPFSYRVIYGDTDQMGVMYYANYLRLFEAGRCEYMHVKGCPYSEVEGRGVLLPISEAHVNYIKPALFDQTITVHTKVELVKGARVNFTYEVTNEDGELLATGFTKHAALDAERRVIRVPADLVDLLEPEKS
ncbi:MAG: thioesterase [Deltaproteobacteria bacterium]|nr:MAG: thioesterase [Deltaproteobacteria bacterium]